MPDSRPPIPRALAREVRQRCGFGCVICGIPLFEYDHLLGWANVSRHRAQEITLLCDQHHREKTAGLLPDSIVHESNEHPYNLRSGESAPYNLWYGGNTYKFDIGNNHFFGTIPATGLEVQPLRIDGVPVLSARLEDGHYLLSFEILDSTGTLVAKVHDNELVMSATVWDVELIGTSLTIREGHRRVLVDIQFSPPSGVKIRRGRFLRNGVELLVSERWAALLNNCMLLAGSSCSGGVAGLVVGDDADTMPAAFRIADVPRDGWDRSASLRWVREQEAAAVQSLSDVYGAD